MTPEEKVAHDALMTEIKSEIEKGTKADKETIEALKSKLEAIENKSKDFDYSVVKSELIRVAAELKALKETPANQPVGHTSFKDALTAAFAEKSEEIAEILKNGGKQTKTLSLTVKTVGAMSVASTIGAGSTQVTIT
jgi:hypothetical protein